jgi:hypothetical protein
MNTQRDYNKELKDTIEHKYAYSFDFDVMHPSLEEQMKLKLKSKY